MPSRTAAGAASAVVLLTCLVPTGAPLRAQCQIARVATAEFGQAPPGSLAVDGDTLALCHYEEVSIYEERGGVWTETARLDVDNGVLAGATKAALDGDTLVVGAPIPLFPVSGGKAFVFTRSGEGWTLAATLEPNDGEGRGFGTSVALDGDTLVVGRPGPGSPSAPGSVHVYARNGTVWTEEAVLGAAGAVEPDAFGSAVALRDGRLLVGAPIDAEAGSVTVFERDAAGWSETARLVPLDPEPGSRFGATVAQEGATLAVGATGGLFAGVPTAVHVFEQDAGGWIERSEFELDLFLPNGPALTVTADVVLAGATQDPEGVGGSALLYRSVDGDWSLERRLRGIGLESALAGFGASVASRDDGNLFVLAPGGIEMNEEFFAYAFDPGCPTVDFAGDPLVGSPPLTVDFSDLSSGGVTSWAWDFGDGATSTLQSPSHEYATAGSFDVALAAGNAVGMDLELKGRYVVADPSVVAFSGSPLSGATPLAVAFVDESQGGPILAWDWDFGDGATSSEQNPVHVYTDAGTFSVRLTVDFVFETDTHVEPDYVTVQWGASATPRNGSGTNPVCLTSPGLPVVGTAWLALIDTSGLPEATLAHVVGYDAPRTGPTYPFGELLVDVAAGLVCTRSAVPVDGLATILSDLADDPALLGLRVYTQAVVSGGGLQLCNALDLVLGIAP